MCTSDNLSYIYHREIFLINAKLNSKVVGALVGGLLDLFDGGMVGQVVWG